MGPHEVDRVVNNAMIRIKEEGVDKPRYYMAHISKLRLAKRMGVKYTNPVFKLPRLPKKIMENLEEELSTV